MIPEQIWWKLREQFRKSVPTIVSPNYVKSLLGYTSDESARANVISPLKQLGLIDSEGKTMQLAYDWRSDEKYPSVCKGMLERIYPQELLDLFPDSDIDVERVKRWFMDTAGVGEQAASKYANTFLLLKNGSVRVNNKFNPCIHIDIQVHISPEASAEQIDKIFESMAKHLFKKE